MKVLVVCYSKMKGYGGGVFAARATVNALASICEDVTVLFPADQDGERDEELFQNVRQIGVTDPVSKARKFLRCILRGTLHRMERVFGELLAKESFDCIVFHNSKASRRLIGLAKVHGAKVVTIHDNYEPEYTRDSFPWYDLLYMLPITVRGERDAVLQSDLNLVLSIQDRNLLWERYDPDRRARIEVLGVFEYRDRPMPVLSDPVEEDVYVITGNLGARQTLDSLFPWLNEYWPLVQEKDPTAKLLVAGKNPGQVLRNTLESLGAELVPDPADMDDVLLRGRFYVCPVSKGGGVKLRVMDGLRHGLPVLVHQVSARGYESFMDRSLFVYDSRESFKDALDRLRESKMERSTILETYSASFSFLSGTIRMKSLLSSL